MNTTSCSRPKRGHAWYLPALLLAAATFSSSAQSTEPTITSVRIEGTNIVVTARVPSGLKRVTLECRERFGAGTWEPRAISRTAGTGTDLTFRLPRSRKVEIMRVRGDATEPLPAAFYSGTNSFYNPPSSSGDPRMMGAPTADGLNAGAPAEGASRAVVESDIWKTRGDTLYFFNQLRGLQIIDLRRPDAAVVRGTLDLPATGEQMYLLGAHHVVLLAGNGCSAGDSQVLIVADTNGPPTVAARLPVSGYIQESRMVGTALYVASQTYRPVAGSTNSTWEWGTQVSSFDLSVPDAPVARGTLWYAGYGNVVAANDRLLFVVTQDPANWWQSIVRCIDITAPDGTMRAYESFRVAGRVQDKFKLNWDGGILTSISEDWHGNNGTRLVTRLETFRLPDPRALGPLGVIKLGELELGLGERLHATRFDGTRAYVVTFFQIDPLWVVDLSNPSAPRIAGSVDVPGWSTYIHPLGPKLVSIGVDGSRVAVSLFDVQNPAAPSLLSRVRLGENYSWSEGNWDEKAFSVLPDAGLILVPYSGNTTNGYASQVQLIDLNASTLVARGVIEHQFAPRRATLYTDRILAISGWELLSVDAADRDHPVVRGSTPLAWSVDRVFAQGEHLIELATSTGWWWAGQGTPIVRVAPANAPDRITGQITLVNLPVLGATVRDGRLYVAQGETGWVDPWPVADGAARTNTSKFMLTVIGLDQLPALPVVGQTETQIEPLGWSTDWQAVWPRTDVLVWVGGGFQYFGRFGGGISPLADVALVGRLWWPFPSSGGGNLIAFEVGTPTAPRFASQVDLGSNGWWGFSKAFTAEGSVYLSHQTSEFFPWVIPASPAIGGAAVAGGTPVQDPATGGDWVSRSYLNVVDYADARHPLVRPPVNIPGTLHGLSHQGAVLYTVGTHYSTNQPNVWTEFLDASAHDGVSAHLIDSLVLPESWPRPVLVDGTNVFVGRSGYTNGWWWPASPGASNVGPHTVETWHLSDAGKFTRSGSVTLATPASELAGFGSLLAAQESDNAVSLFDPTNGATLRRVGHGQPSGCLWYNLKHASGELGRGLWIPLGAYGVATIPAGP